MQVFLKINYVMNLPGSRIGGGNNGNNGGVGDLNSSGVGGEGGGGGGTEN